MVERLCSDYGTAIPYSVQYESSPAVMTPGNGPEDDPNSSRTDGPVRPFYAFPTLDQLSRATEEELRASGFGWGLNF
jgi:hypothetical protein